MLEIVIRPRSGMIIGLHWEAYLILKIKVINLGIPLRTTLATMFSLTIDDNADLQR